MKRVKMDMITPHFLAHQIQPMTVLSRSILENEVWREVIVSSQAALKNFDAGITDEFDFLDFTDRKFHRLVRFCLPLFEIGSALDNLNVDSDLLAAMFLWSEVWRPLDDLLDDDGDKIENLICYSQALQRAIGFQASISKGLEYDICQRLNENIEIEKNSSQKVEFKNIYKRASILETPLLCSHGYSTNTVHQFRKYINIIGLSHDIVDLIRDLKSGQMTLPTYEFIRLDPTLSLLPSKLDQVISICREKFIVENKKLIATISNSKFITTGNLAIEYDYAFRLKAPVR